MTPWFYVILHLDAGSCHQSVKFHHFLQLFCPRACVLNCPINYVGAFHSSDTCLIFIIYSFFFFYQKWGWVHSFLLLHPTYHKKQISLFISKLFLSLSQRIQKVQLPFHKSTRAWSKSATFPCEYSTACKHNWVQRSVSIPIRALAPPFQFNFHTHFLNFEFFFFFLPTLSGLRLISDPANKIQIIIHYIFPGATVGSVLRPAQSLHAKT